MNDLPDLDALSDLQQHDAQQQDRREFLAAVGRVAAAIGLLGLAPEAAQASAGAAQRARIQLMTRAIRTGNMAEAIQRYGAAAKLGTKQRDAIRNISGADLAKVRQIGGQMGTALGFAVPCYAIPGGCPEDEPEPPEGPSDKDEPAETESSGGKKVGIIIF